MSSVPQPHDDTVEVFEGRMYPEFCLIHNVYCVPVDLDEEERLDSQHKIIREVLDDAVVLTPFPPPNVAEPEVLECGVGKGVWVDDLLERYETPDFKINVSTFYSPDMSSVSRVRIGLTLILTAIVKVTGIDIYFGKVNDDEQEEGDDMEEEEEKEEYRDTDEEEDSEGRNSGGEHEWFKHRWNLNAPFRDDRSKHGLLPEQFDLINSRMIMDGINADRWPTYTRELLVLLKPGGWLQMVEVELRFQSDSGLAPIDDTDPLFRWQQEYYRAMDQMGKDPRVGRRLGGLLTQAGFQQMSHVSHRLQIGRWNTTNVVLGQTNAVLGQSISENAQKHIEAVSLWPLTGAKPPGQQRMSTPAYRQLVQEAQQALRNDPDSTMRWYYIVHVATGRKPISSRR